MKVERDMNIAQRFSDFRTLVEESSPVVAMEHAGAISQAAATLVLAEVMQRTTHYVDLSFDQNSPLKAEASVGGDYQYPLQVEQRR